MLSLQAAGRDAALPPPSHSIPGLGQDHGIASTPRWKSEWEVCGPIPCSVLPPLKEGRTSVHQAAPVGCKSHVYLQVTPGLPRAAEPHTCCHCLLAWRNFPRELEHGLQTFGISGRKIRKVTLLRNTPPKFEGPGLSQLWMRAGAATAPWEVKCPPSFGRLVEREPSWPTFPNSAVLRRWALMQFFAFH